MKASYIVAATGVVIIIAATGFFALRQTQPIVAPPSPPKTVATPQAPTPAPAPKPAPPEAAADCLLPGPPPVPPDGGNATDADMKLGHDVIQAFVKQLEAYQACRISQIDHAGSDVTPQRKQIWLEQGNAAVDEAHAIADAFGAQLKIYHAKHPGK